MLHMILFSLLCLLAAVDGQSSGITCDPSPEDFRTLFTDACESLKKGDSECAGYWNAFSSSFANKDPSSVSTVNYEKYFDLFEWPENARRDSFLFWSGTLDLSVMLSCMCEAANVFAGPSYDPVAIVGKITDRLKMRMMELRWCGTTRANSGDGIEYDEKCNCKVSYAFFEEFSFRFAKAARGTIFYLGHGESTNGAFNKMSIFAEIEIPNLDSTSVRSAVILVVHNTTVNKSAMSESCGQGSLVTLRNRLVAKNIAYTCYDVFGDLSNLTEITNCTTRIITSIQNKMEPAADDCFSKETRRDFTTFFAVFIPSSIAFQVLAGCFCVWCCVRCNRRCNRKET